MGWGGGASGCLRFRLVCPEAICRDFTFSLKTTFGQALYVSICYVMYLSGFFFSFFFCSGVSGCIRFPLSFTVQIFILFFCLLFFCFFVVVVLVRMLTFPL